MMKIICLLLLISSSLFSQDKAIKKDSISFDSIYTLGMEMIKTKNFKSASLYSDSLLSIPSYSALSNYKQHSKLLWIKVLSQSGQQAYTKSIAVNSDLIQLLRNQKDTLNDFYEGVINEIAFCYFMNGDNDISESYYLLNLEINKLLSGEENKKNSKTLNNLGIVNSRKLEYAKAENFFRKSSVMKKNIYGENSLDFGLSLVRIAMLYDVTQRFSEALELYKTNASILEKIGKTQTDSYAKTLEGIASNLMRMGQFKEAEKYFFKELELYENNIALKKNMNYPDFLRAFGTYYREVGNGEKARDFFSKAISSAEKIWGNTTWNYYGFIYFLANSYQANNADYQKSYDILKSIIDTNKMSSQERITNLPKVYKLYYKASEKLGIPVSEEQYLQLNKECLLAKDTITYIDALANFGAYLASKNRFAEAIELEQKVYNFRKSEYGPSSNVTIASYYRFCNYFAKTNQYDSLNKYLNLLYNSNRNLTESSFDFLTEEELPFFMSNTNNFIFSVLNDADPINTSITEYAYNDAIAYKGILQNAKIKRNRIYSKNELYKSLQDSISFIQRSIAQEYSKLNSNKLEDLKKQNEKLLKKLVLLSDDQELLNQIQWQSIQSILEPNQAALEFVLFPKTEGLLEPKENIYAALLIRKDDPKPILVNKFKESDLKKLLGDVKIKRIEYVNKFYYLSNKNPNANSLYQLVWKNIIPFLHDIKTVFYSPVGLLNTINASALPISSWKNLQDSFNLVLVQSTRNLLELKNNSQNQTNREILLVGGVEYNKMNDNDLAANIEDTKSQSFATRSFFSFYNNDTTFRNSKWKYLPGSLQEVDKLNSIFKNAKWNCNKFTGIEATESQFKSFGKSTSRENSPAVIHISTHGFFFPDPNNASALNNAFQRCKDPMIRSGLILSGANSSWQQADPKIADEEDGILTAYEISLMDLNNTDLVVLSACETGLGEVQGSEGVYGLQRAFKIAGVKNIIMSLWQVPDKQTAELMELFYKNWLIEKMSTRAALASAQKTMRDKKLEPYYWAGFVLME